MDDEYEKFAEMQKYIPFLEAMIERLQCIADTDSRYYQLQKMQGLHEILSNKRTQNLKIETLQRWEDVLQNLYNKYGHQYNKIKKGNPPSSQPSYEQNDDDDVILLSPSSTSKAELSRCRQARPGESQGVEKDKEIETPQSPDTIRSSSPDCEILPIIIPTERSTELNRSRKQKQYPSNTGTKVIPVITLTDTDTITISPTESNSDVTFSERDMLEESERHNARNKGNRQPLLVATSHDVMTAAKLISNSLPQKVSDSKNYTLNSQDIPTVPDPSLGGSRRLSSVLEKNRRRLDIITGSSLRAESPVNVPEVRLNSPDPEILFAKPRARSPRSKESHNMSSPKPPSIPLLFLLPHLLHKPPLSMEDLAELLNDEGNGKKSDKVDGNAAKQKQDADKVSRNFSLSEREKPLTARKSFPNTGVKSSEITGPPHRSNDSLRSNRQKSFLSSEFQEPRYADNYERHSRQRDAHVHESAKDKTITIINETPSQTGLVFHNSRNKLDERNVPLYHRRPSVPSVAWNDVNLSRENEFVIDNNDYYRIHANHLHWTSRTATSDYQFDTNQWTSFFYGGMTNPPLQSTQHPFPRPLMEPQFRQNQFPSNLPADPRPLMNPTVRPQEMSYTVRSENIREDMIPPDFPSQYRAFQMPQGSYEPVFSVSRSMEYPQVRSTWEGSASRVSEATYENVIPCGNQVVDSTSTSVAFPRPSTPYPRDTRDRGNRNKGKDGCYDKNRTEVRPSFNRDVRRSDWSREGHSDRENPYRLSNRDPHVRTEHNADANQAKETGASARDSRLAKDKHVNVSTKAKDTTHNERDPRKRSGTMNTKSTKEKSSLHKSSEKENGDKLLKDRMQSPLESLYGAIDTTVSQNSGLQKYKIPKIKRPEAPRSNCVANETKKVETTSSKLPRVKSSSKNCKSCSKNKSKDVASTEVSSSSDSNRATENLVQQSNAAREGKISSSLAKSDKNETKINEADSVTDSKSSNVAKKGKNVSEADGRKSKSKEEATQELIEALIRKSFESGECKKLVEQMKLIKKFGEALKPKKLKKLKKIIESESESSSDKDETYEAKKTQTKKKRRVIVSDNSDDERLVERLGILTTNTDTDVERGPADQNSTISTDLKNSEEKLEVAVSSNNSSKELINDITAKDSLLEIRDKERVQVDNNKNKDIQLKKSYAQREMMFEETSIDINLINHFLLGKANRLENGKNTVDQSRSKKQTSSSRLEDNDKEKKQTEDNQNKINHTIVEKSKKSTRSNKECLNQNSTGSLDQNKNQTTRSLRLKKSILSFDSEENQSLAVRIALLNNSDNSIPNQKASNDKTKLKTRKNSLKMSQEDIREVFISEGAITATGFRMCGLSKESQSPSRMSTLSIKKDVLSNIKKKITESNTETNESAANNAAKSRRSSRFRGNVEESSKPEAKSKNNPKQTIRSVRLKKLILSSDSEENQPLALRLALLNNSDNSIPNQEVDRSAESNDTLCTSNRVSRKEIVYRNIKKRREIKEKTDITKIDLFKVVFDSSSDEGFSFRANKRSDQGLDTVKRQKDIENTDKRHSRSRNSLLIDDKSENKMLFTDEDSTMSNISMSSSATVRVGTCTSTARTAREELLSNIRIELVPPTENTLTDKGSETEDAYDPLAIEPSKTKLLKKKKKKSRRKRNSWKMGIVYEKKKKKSASGAFFKTAQTSIEETNTETNVSTDTAEVGRLTEVIDKESAVEGEIPEKILGNYDDDANPNSILNDIKPLINTDSFNFDMLSGSTNTFNDSIEIEENKLLVKMEVAETLNSADLIATNAATRFFKESSIIYDELMVELFRRIDIKHLIDYAWFGQGKYKCLLCFFTGKSIVHHYKFNHPGKEVLISRLKSTDAQTAIVDAECGTTLPSSTETGQIMCKFCCRFCCFVTEGAADVALEAFYEHCTTHTGEYRFHCNNCSYQTVAKASMKTHYYKICRGDKTFNESMSEDIIPKEGGIYGYLCRSCNYVQLKRQNVEAHVAFWHREQSDTNILKINMSAIIVEQACRTNRNCRTDKNQSSHESTSINAEEFFAMETKPRICFEFEATECKDELLMDIARLTEFEDNNENIQIKEEGSMSIDNQSGFVCSPELENKEMEIQRERQETMQEIANNNGILLRNSKPNLSIIDKLQENMRTDVVASPFSECNSLTDIPEARENSSLPFVNSFEEPIKTEEIIIKQEPLSQLINQEDSFTEELATDKSEITNAVNDKVDVKIRDPPAIMGSFKDTESDGESMLDIKKEIKREPISLIPNPPDVVPITSVECPLLNQQNVKNEEMLTLFKNASSTKNIIKFRCLSGDVLSISTQDTPEDLKEFNTDEVQSDSAIDAHEECSFLKIEKVISLAKPDHNENSIEMSKKDSTESCDYEKCPYCYISLSDWTSMKTHLWEKHNCRYQCDYCFYRAIASSDVQYQATCHPGTTTIKCQCEERPGLKRKLLELIEGDSLAKRLQF